MASKPMAPPDGMRDLLPPASMARSVLRQRIMETFALHGYQRLTTPPIEYERVLADSLETLESRDLLRFIEPNSGEVALLRPDITPQVARIVATRLADRPAPWRLCYEGTVIRRPRGRARRQQQVFQSGVELIGLSGAAADAEVIELAASTCKAIGLDAFTIELAHVGIGSEALDAVPVGAARDAAQEALAKKDKRLLESRLKRAGVVSKDRRLLQTLADLHGDASILDVARRRLRNPKLQRCMDALQRVIELLRRHGVEQPLHVDLGELRGQSYYTGVSATLLADGPGEPLGKGGRYDNLLAHFGESRPATGFAFDLDNLEWALRSARKDVDALLPPRALVIGGTPSSRRKASQLLREGSIRALESPEIGSAAKAFAKAWNFDLLVSIHKPGAKVTRVRGTGSKSIGLDAAGVQELLAWASQVKKR